MSDQNEALVRVIPGEIRAVRRFERIRDRYAESHASEDRPIVASRRSDAGGRQVAE